MAAKSRHATYEENRRNGFTDAISKGEHRGLEKRVPGGIYVDKIDIDGFPCYYLRPNRNFEDVYFFYVYDSDYCYDINDEELRFLCSLLRQTGHGAFVPMYPLAPRHKYDEVSAFMLKAYKNFIGTDSDRDITVVACGVGAGIALSLIQNAWKEGIRKADRLFALSPVMDYDYIHADYTGDYVDICEDIFIISGMESRYSVQARKLSNRLIDQGLNVKFIEYKEMDHDFFFSLRKKQTRHMMKVLHDYIRGDSSEFLADALYEVKRRSDISKKFSGIFSDHIATRYISKHSESFRRSHRVRWKDNMLLAANYKAFDDSVRLFLKEYPNATVIYLGCGLDTMFERVDNGRVRFYNLDRSDKMAVRGSYWKPGDREFNITRSIDDMAWLDDIDEDISYGMLFVCRGIFSYYRPSEVREYILKIYEKFPGAHVLMDMNKQATVFARDYYQPYSGMSLLGRRFFGNDPGRIVSLWSPVIDIIYVRNMTGGIKPMQGWSFLQKMRLRLINLSHNYKLIYMKLGFEEYMRLERYIQLNIHKEI